ncbi:MAG: diadenylate cyclase CdaA [Clostridia bacterium]|nr:diadenylate cyclase CdaA [Clostridia bacterium]
MWESIVDFFSTILGKFNTPHVLIDIIDIIVVAFLIYKVLQLAVETRAEQLLKGVVLVIALYAVANWLDMVAINFIMSNILDIGILAVLILFQPEIRRALEQVGRSKLSESMRVFSRDNGKHQDVAETQKVVNEICAAASSLSLSKTGALMCLEKETKLGEVVATGTDIHAHVTAELLENIFYPKAPLHDGAVVISKNRIRSAGCFLPLSQNYEISKELGTRHRAALGLSEVSDAVIVVVSEETGKISFVQNGQMLRGLTPDELRNRLYVHFIKPLTEQKTENRTKRSRFQFLHSEGRSNEKK